VFTSRPKGWTIRARASWSTSAARPRWSRTGCTETKELFGGYFLVDVASKQEAVEWAKRVPSVPGSKIEIRRVLGEDEVPQDNEGIDEKRAGRESNGQF
jgi:hypothetical protein